MEPPTSRVPEWQKLSWTCLDMSILNIDGVANRSLVRACSVNDKSVSGRKNFGGVIADL